MSKGSSHGVCTRMAFQNLLEFKRNSDQEFKRNYEKQLTVSQEAGQTGGGQGSESDVPSQALDSVCVTPAQVPKVEASDALFQRHQRRLNDITPVKIQEHVELLENLSKAVVAKDMVVEGLPSLRESLGPVQDKASMQFK
eukprot:CAMPEP_0115073718 /NCGR_PEP_ID=MMETSP0227-20121206/14939_1 /TAXON_ID=89957 /ORGANISM="Polarella glacialis, Strain CCMP 1383" /LENGTH=139 /DNA_ID=CAMNT_0002460603 /DNA_START=40 /DNA_END=459 /DNA_ORIENTATION=+